MRRNNVPLEDNEEVFGAIHNIENSSKDKEDGADNPVSVDVDIESVMNTKMMWKLSWFASVIILVTWIAKIQVINTAIGIGLIVSLLQIKKHTQKIEYTQQSNYYSMNFATTLKMFLGKQMKMDKFYPHAATLGWLGITFVALDQLLLRSLLSYSISTIIQSIGLLIFVISVLMLFTIKDIGRASTLVGALGSILLLLTGVVSALYGYLNGQNIVLGLVALYAAEWLKRAELKEINLATLKEEIDNANQERAKDTKRTKNEQLEE